MEDALFVPLQSIFLESGVHYCRVLEDGKPVRREIEVGLSSDKYMQVVSGLEEGEQVLAVQFVHTICSPEHCNDGFWNDGVFWNHGELEIALAFFVI